MSRRVREQKALERLAPLPPSAQLQPTAAAAALGADYLCVACELRWPYRTVRNTGRCPTCGGGLLRADAPGR